MMKRTLCAILSALFLSIAAIPCSATDTEIAAQREYHGFSDVAQDSWCYEAVKLCYEAGLMNGTTDTTFSPQSPLTAAQLTVLAARLYDLRSDGTGVVPELPDLTESYLRFYDEAGNLIRAYTLTDAPVYSAIEEDSVFISLSEMPGDPSLPETCILEIGFPEYCPLRRYTGLRASYETMAGTMSHGLSGTGYRITAPQIAARCFFLGDTRAETLAAWQNSWWFPAAFYLSSQGLLNLSGDLIYRLDPEAQYTGQYDLLFSQSATRALAAWLMDLSAGELTVRNEWTHVPADVDPEDPDAAAIVRLYQAGVLTGVDAENFAPDAPLTRAQAAVIFARILDPDLRVTLQTNGSPGISNQNER